MLTNDLTTEMTLPQLGERYGIPYQTLTTAAQSGRLVARKAGPRAWLVRPIEVVAAMLRGDMETRELPGVRIWRTYNDDYAIADAAGDGPCRIGWVDEQGQADPDEEVDGYVVADRLFWPGTNYSHPGDYITEDGQPDPDAPWGDIETGQPAIIGLPGSPLAVLL